MTKCHDQEVFSNDATILQHQSIDVNVKNRLGISPIFISTSDIKLFDALVGSGKVDFSCLNNNWENIYHYAAANAQVLKKLMELDVSADPTSPGVSGKTPLDKSKSKDCQEILKEIISKYNNTQHPQQPMHMPPPPGFPPQQTMHGYPQQQFMYPPQQGYMYGYPQQPMYGYPQQPMYPPHN